MDISRLVCPPPQTGVPDTAEPKPLTPNWLPSAAENPAVLFAGEAPYLIVDVNDAWLRACGFSRVEIIGKSMTLIQGPETERNLIRDLMLAVKRRQPQYSTVLTNYTKGGDVFANNLEISLVGAADGLASEHFLARSTIEWITIESHGRRTPWQDRFRCKGLSCACCVPGSAAVCGEQSSSHRSSLVPTTPSHELHDAVSSFRASDSTESEMYDLPIKDEEQNPVMTSVCNTAPSSGTHSAVNPAANAMSAAWAAWAAWAA